MKNPESGMIHYNRKPQELPAGDLMVDPEALRRARQGVPKGDLHN